MLLVVGQDHAAAGAADRLVDRGRDDVGMRHRVRVQVGRHQPGEVGHVREQDRADVVGDLAEQREVELAGIGGPAGDDQLGPVLGGELGDLVHVHEAVLAAHVVGDDVVEAARDVLGHPVGQVAAVGEVEAEDRVARLEQREVGGRVRRAPECGCTLA